MIHEVLCFYGEIQGGKRHKVIDPVSIDTALNGKMVPAIVCRTCALEREKPQVTFSTHGTQTATIAAPQFLTSKQMEMLKNLKPQTKSDEETDRKFQEVVDGYKFDFS